MISTTLTESLQQQLHATIGLDPQALGPVLLEQAAQSLRATNIDLNDRHWIDLLASDPSTQAQVRESVLVTETWFQRDAAQFADLAIRAAGLRSTQTLNVLSLPCATGEEPLSIAASLLAAGQVDFQVWGVDVSERAINHARTAVYSNHSLRGQPAPNWLEANDAHWVPVAQVRDRVRYLCLNLLDPDLIAKLPQAQFIFSRNFLIYLHPQAQQQWLTTLAALLAPGGVIYSGSAEPLSRLNPAWQQIEANGALLYQRSEPPSITQPAAVAPPDRLAVPVTDASAQAESRHAATATVAATAAVSLVEQAQAAADLGQLKTAVALLDQHLAAAPLDADAWHLSALVHLGLGQDSLATEHWARVLYLDRYHLGALQYLRTLAQRVGDLPRAEQLQRRIQARARTTTQGQP